MPSAPLAEPRRGLLPAAVLLFVIAALCVVRAWLPVEWVAEAWNQGSALFAAFYLTLLGVGLAQASDPARRFVCLASVLLLPIAALSIVLGNTQDKLLGLALLALAAGLIGLLIGRRPSASRVAASLALGASGAALVFPMEIALARAPREAARRTLAEWTAAQTAYARDDIGVRLAVPQGWVLLRDGSPYVPVDPATVVVLLQAETEARAVLTLELDPRSGESLDDYLDRYLERWQQREPELAPHERGSATLGDVKARRVDVAWTREEVAYAGHAVAWQDASRTLVLATWYRAKDAEAARPAVEELQAALVVTRPLQARIARTAAAAGPVMPQLSPHAIELLVARRPDADLAALFRESLAVASLGFQRLENDQVRDMGEINRALYGQMPPADSSWMEDYVRRVRAREPTGSEEDERAMRAMAAAVGRLPETSRARLRSILEHAVAAAVRG